MSTHIKTPILLAVCLAIIVASDGVSSHQVPSSDHYMHSYDPYSYGYETEDNYGNKQWRQERSSHPHEVHGSYGYRDKNGVYREVTYTADQNGFRANIKTNEPGVSDKSPASTKMDSYYAPVQSSMAPSHQQHHAQSTTSHHHQAAASPPVYPRQHYTSATSYHPSRA